MNASARNFGTVFVAVWFTAIASFTVAQVAPVDVGTASGISWAVVLVALVGVAVVFGAIYLHRKNPTAEAAALAQAHSDMAMIATKAHDALNWSQEHVAALIAKLPPPKATGGPQAAADGSEAIQGAADAPAAPAGPTAEQLAAVESAKAAYNASLAAVGQPPV